jgi:hypothetical protein
VPLHPRIVDILSSQGEKLVPESMERLFQVARDIEQQLVLSPPALCVSDRA